MALISDRMSEATKQAAPGIGGELPPEDEPSQAVAPVATEELAGERMMEQEEPGKPKPNVTPEKQAIYTSIVTNAIKIIYGDQMDQTLNLLNKAGSPAEGVAQAANTIGDQIYKVAKKQGKNIPDTIMMAAAKEIVQLLFELGKESGAFKSVSDDDQFSAMTRLLQLWDESHPGMLDREGMKKSMAGMDKSAVSELMGQMGGDGGGDGGNTK